MQPEYSFDHHGISSANSARDFIKRQIRQAFLQAGVPYNIELITQPDEALKYMKPIDTNDPPVEWWKET